MSGLEALSQRVAAAFGRPRRPAVSLGLGLDVYVGLDHRTRGGPAYHWNGLRRGGDPRRPYAVVQYTLAGRGLFRTTSPPGTREHVLTPGTVFAAIVPSAHEYLMPPDSERWAWFWLIVHHPYLVERVRALAPPAGPVLHAPPEGELATALVDLVESHRNRTDDRFTREARLFDLIVAFDRTAHAAAHRGDADERERLLRRVRELLDHRPARRPNVDDVAAAFGMSRSHFSHHFHAVTGLSPAAFIRDLRLQRARDLLLSPEDRPLKAIARATGFADANHLCKAFRLRFGFTPGSFRAQMRASSTGADPRAGVPPGS